MTNRRTQLHIRIILNWISCPLHIARDSADPRSKGIDRLITSEPTLDQGSVLPFRLLHRHLLMCQHYWSQIRCSWLLQSSTSDQGSVLVVRVQMSKKTTQPEVVPLI